MQQDDVRALFDQMADGYDTQWGAMTPLRDGLHFLVAAAFADLPENARILCVGAGTGAELAVFAQRFPGWHFTAVDPSGPMLDVCRRRAQDDGFDSRCAFHEGYLDSLPESEPYHAATCFLVSHFFLDREERAAFFRDIAQRLRHGGLLASSDLAADADAVDPILRVWLTVMAGPGVTAEKVEQARATYAKDVALLPPARVADVIKAGGFTHPVQVFQAGLLHAWLATRA